MEQTGDSKKDKLFTRLKHSLQALALDGPEQLSLLPDFVVKSEELASDFKHWYGVVQKDFEAELTKKQSKALFEIDITLTGMWELTELWTEGSILNGKEWQSLREEAKAALAAFGWEVEVPRNHFDGYQKGEDGSYWRVVG